MLRLYAIVEAGTDVAIPALRAVPLGALAAVVEDAAGAPAITAEALRGHDRVVRDIASRVDALLPARFGILLEDEADLRRELGPRQDALVEALALVRGCEQMTVRVFGKSTPGVRPASGADYLRARAAGIPGAPELRAAVASLVRAERVERSGRAPLLGSVYHLVPRGGGTEYRERVSALAPPPSLRFRLSGPWAPYAFATGAAP